MTMGTITDIYIELHRPTAEEIGVEVDLAAYHRGLQRFWMDDAQDALEQWIEEHEGLALADCVSIHFEWTDEDTQVDLVGDDMDPMDRGQLEWEIEDDVATKAEALGVEHMFQLDR
jgi:hypothetical protein